MHTSVKQSIEVTKLMKEAQKLFHMKREIRLCICWSRVELL